MYIFILLGPIVTQFEEYDMNPRLHSIRDNGSYITMRLIKFVKQVLRRLEYKDTMNQLSHV